MFKIGQLINWFEDYDDGIAGKDWGDGIIIDKKQHDTFGYGSYILYKVYRNKHKDFYWFESTGLRQKNENINNRT